MFQYVLRRDAVACVISLVLLAVAATWTGAVRAGEVLRSGTMTGQSDHVMTGAVSIERDGDKVFVVLGDDFSLDGAPDPTLGFSKGGKIDDATLFAKLEKKTGAQRYEVPAAIDVAGYDAFTVYCKKFSVPLGSASLN